MIAREVPVQDVLRVVLQSGTQNLEEVVVTAIGMKKQEKALGCLNMKEKSIWEMLQRMKWHRLLG